MAKGIGLIGNFKGKVGNMVGYKLTDSNSGNNQGIRVYQPIVKNPKTAAQAEQRAKLAPINATYRALKMIIDRGNEGLPYGNKSRLAWLKQAFKAESMPWVEKGKVVEYPVGCQLTKGSLAGVVFEATPDDFAISCTGVTSETTLNTVASLSTALLAGYPGLKLGDQLTIACRTAVEGALAFMIKSFVLDDTDNTAITGFRGGVNSISFEPDRYAGAGVAIISREGANGEHLRSTTYLSIDPDMKIDAPYDADSKAAAIESYRSSAAVNADWAEESIQ